MASVVQNFTSLPNAEAYTFQSSSFFMFSYYWDLAGRPIELPMGYEDRIFEAGQGIIVRDWAPRLEILAHTSTSGFLSHCGWNSCLESMTMGVPIATWPMHSDQPKNACYELVTQQTHVLKLGRVVKEWTHRNDLVESLQIERAVRKLLASKGGDEMRKRAAELRIDIKILLQRAELVV
ncbi:zeatin O-glucosyltransferase-like [Apium graveolens]|uniref:zeatin O-glucosyltransferase-like n=1 Tax=Apium graveolens TaxID=4045 RepID=UPI003D7B2434